jgi:nucleoid-associated protein YgaU
VALAEDRDRRADAPDERNRCYAEKAPRRRDMVYQADFCYSARFATCSTFLAWAARNAAEPAYVTEAARKAWASGIASPEGRGTFATDGLDEGSGSGADAGAGPSTASGAVAMPVPAAEEGLFGPPDPSELDAGARAAVGLDWVSASAWAEAPWDEDAESAADELEATAAEPSPEDAPAPSAEAETAEEDLRGPRVPAALPMRRRREAQPPIRARGSGEWFFADPLDRGPLVRRRSGAAPPILLTVLGLLVVSIIVLLLPSLLGGRDDGSTAALPTAAPGASARPLPTRAPLRTAPPDASPSPSPEPQVRVYTVRPGDTLTGIAAKASVGVSVRLLQCINGLTNPNLLQPGQKLLIPPDGYSCPAGWRRASPPPIP